MVGGRLLTGTLRNLGWGMLRELRQARSLKGEDRGTQGGRKQEEGLPSFKSTCRSNGGEKGPPELVQCRRLFHLLGGVARDRQDEPGAC